MVVKGTRWLKKPNVSSSFVWNGRDVASLAGQGSLYILAKSELQPQDANERDEESMQVSDLPIHVYYQSERRRNDYAPIILNNPRVITNKKFASTK